MPLASNCGLLLLLIATLYGGYRAFSHDPALDDVHSLRQELASSELTPEQRREKRDELRAAMMMMVRGLGVRCITCHVGKEPDDLSTFDFQSDAKQNKLNARLMLKMQNDINEKTLPKVKPDPPDTDKAQVTCFTCHQKQLKPPAPPSTAGALVGGSKYSAQRLKS